MASTSQFVIEHYLQRSLGEEGDSAQLLELRTDILYLLTDTFAHRRALPLDRLVEELHRLQHPELALSSSPVTKPQVRDEALELLCKRGIVRRYEGKETEYELAHDFLVRSVLKAWKQLERERMEQAIVLRQEREKVGERLVAFDSLSNAVLRILPVTTIATFLYIAYVGFWSTLPSWLGIAILWIVVCQALLILFVGLARKFRVAAAFGLLSIVVCGGIWVAERSIPRQVSLRVNEQASRMGSQCRKLVSLYQQSGSQTPSTSSKQATESLCYGLGYTLWISTDSLSAANDFLTSCRNSADLSQADEFCSSVETIAGKEFSRWPTLRPYQMGTFVAWIVLGCCCPLIALYPNILFQIRPKDKRSERRSALLIVCSNELIDVVLQLAVAGPTVYLARAIQSDGTSPFWDIVSGEASWREVLPNSHQSFWLSVLATVFATAVISSAFVLWKHKTPAGLITGVGLEPRSQWSIGRVFARQLCFSIWTCLNAFLLLPSLIITPIFLAIRGSQQTICDWLCGFTEVLPVSSHAVTKTVDRATSATAV